MQKCNEWSDFRHGGESVMQPNTQRSSDHNGWGCFFIYKTKIKWTGQGDCITFSPLLLQCAKHNAKTPGAVNLEEVLIGTCAKDQPSILEGCYLYQLWNLFNAAPISAGVCDRGFFNLHRSNCGSQILLSRKSETSSTSWPTYSKKT